MQHSAATGLTNVRAVDWSAQHKSRDAAKLTWPTTKCEGPSGHQGALTYMNSFNVLNNLQCGFYYHPTLQMRKRKLR